MGNIAIGMKTSYRPLGITAGGKFPNNGYSPRDSPNIYPVFETSEKQRSYIGTLLVQKETRGRRDFMHKATK